MAAGIRAWVVLTAIGTLIVIGLQWLLRQRDPLWVLPLVQSVGLTVTWMIAWPLWFRQHPRGRSGFLVHGGFMLVIAGLVAAARIALQTG